MLVLTRRKNESIRIGEQTKVVVLEVRGRQVKLGFCSPPDVPIHREEVYERLAEDHDGLREAAVYADPPDDCESTRARGKSQKASATS